MDIPEFEFDPEKSQLNFVKHGIDFEEAQDLWSALHVEVEARQVNQEPRRAIIGKVCGLVFAAIFAYRVGVVRLISCHRADKRFIKHYEEAIDEKEEN